MVCKNRQKLSCHSSGKSGKAINKILRKNSVCTFNTYSVFQFNDKLKRELCSLHEQRKVRFYIEVTLENSRNSKKTACGGILYID